jgi:hypothetical protein
MATAEEIGKDTKGRILADLKYFNNNMPERYSIAWGGYIASLYEWSFITQEYFAQLVALLPEISEPNPIAEIFEGRDAE